MNLSVVGLDGLKGLNNSVIPHLPVVTDSKNFQLKKGPRPPAQCLAQQDVCFLLARLHNSTVREAPGPESSQQAPGWAEFPAKTTKTVRRLWEAKAISVVLWPPNVPRPPS